MTVVDLPVSPPQQDGPVTSAVFISTDFPTLFRMEFPNIVRDCYFILGDRELAKEVAQEAFTRLYLKWNKVSQYDRPGAWVRQVAMRLAVRNRSRRVAIAEKEAAAFEERRAGAPSGLELDVRRAVLLLSRSQRVAVILHYFHDLPVVEVATALRCRESTAKVHLFKARQRLAELLADYRPSYSEEL